MNRGLFISLGLHIVVIAVAYFGIPLLPEKELIVDPPIVVEVVNIDDISNVPPPKPAPAEKPKPKPAPPKPEPKPTPPPPPPTPVKPQPAPKAPEPAPVSEEKVEIVPEKKVEPKPKPVEKPKPEPKPEPKVEKPQPKIKAAKVMRKPKPPKKEPDFASLMKNLTKDLEKQAPKEEEKKQEPMKFDELAQEIQKAIKQPSRFSDASKPLSVTEIDALRQHIAQCWNPPIGAKEAENLKIEIKVTMNPDATVRASSISSRSNLSDPFYLAAAESALRAVNNRRCWPYPLSPEKYNQWKDLTLVFDPKELLGL